MRKHKISINKVQEAFNAAIKRRDGRCMIRDYEPCCGQLECSHFYTVGSSPALRFYPLNAYAQCQKHHWKHHNVWTDDENWSYERFLENHHINDLIYIEEHGNRYIKYTDELKAEIIRLLGQAVVSLDMECKLRLGYTNKYMTANITKIEVVDGKDTDLHIDKPVYAIHLAEVKECK